MLIGIAVLLVLLASDKASSRTPPIDFAVVGQQKCGTSTLWANLVVNPAILAYGDKKETFAFNGDRVIVPPRCTIPLETYIKPAEQQRAAAKRPVLIGDFTATHFACSCCPGIFKLLNPKLKVIVMLRDPIYRAHSRFVEQVQMKKLGNRGYRQPNGTEVGFNASRGFAAYVHWALPQLEGCVQRNEAGEDSPLGRYLRMQCYMFDHIFGFSMYDVFLENYFRHFPDNQVLVAYMEDMAEDPLGVIRKIEKHLGLPPFAYDKSVGSAVFNAHGGYGWRNASASTDHAGLEWVSTGPADEDKGALAEAIERLRAFFMPSMKRLFAWADEGRIAQVPAAWRSVYGRSALDLLLGGSDPDAEQEDVTQPERRGQASSPG
ncbi:hypothetical protein HYH03_011897 [Edaphochlamys debaryana]|uniref:Sulfotransferase n=1 Tax=Edaphochlamys debaryana TaxID=47281 RepID=A0A835XR56_9CHLO|nr:hypothetical protein HYH03_011897 [Edaphochlamys debaryana]|eukprot:KAG2489617.1 hypothetical protein HYH03_011897 [Edaphochlamys debaryana]